MDAGTTYTWTRDNTINVTGLANTGTGDISGTPNNITGTDQTVTYTITPTSADGCVGNPFTATVLVHSEPVGVATPPSQTVCSDEAITTIVLSTSNGMDAGTTYTWTRDNTINVTGLANTGTGDISGTPNNITGTDQTVTYTITPTSADGCVGNPFTATVLVHSEPVGVATPPSQTVCSDEAITTIVLSTSNGMDAGTTYTWTRDNTINVTGLANTGTGDISGTPNNITGTDQTVTYTITPTSADGCVGNPFTATVLVHSEPVGVATPPSQTVCSDEAITTIVLSTSNGMDAGTTYTWTRDNTINVTGLANTGTGDISGTPNNITGTDQTVTYTITPTSADGCVGNPFTATVLVHSEPVGVATPPSQTVCSDEAITTIGLSTSNGMDAGTTYTWTRDNTINVTGLAVNGTGDISGTPNNITDNYQVITYTIIPTSADGCTGNPFLATITVEPTPQATIVTTTPVICDGGNVDITINSPTVPTQPGNLSYVVAVTSTDAGSLGGTASTGFTVVKTDLPYTINGTLTNSSDIPIVVTYTVTPKYNGCNDGPPQFITVTVEPTPQATIITTTPVICDGGNVDVTINSPTVSTIPGNLSYVVAVSSTDDGSLGGTASTGFTLLKTDLPYTINGTLTNSSDIPIVVTYTVTPKYNGCNDGPPQFITVTVEPTPRVTITTTTPVICDGSNVDVTINSPTVPTIPGNLSYVVAVSSTDDGSLGGTASTGFTLLKTDLPYTINGTLTNSSDIPIVVTYTVTPKYNGCNDGPPQFITVTVEPTPRVTITTTTPVICDGSNVDVTINSPTVPTIPGNLSYVVAVSSTDDGSLGGTASTGFTLLKTDLPYTINGTLTNSSDIPIVVTYTVTPKYNGCNDGPPQFITVTVEPTPRVTITTTTPVICDGSNVDVTINSPTVPTIPGNLSYVVAVSSTDDGSLGGTASTGFTLLKTDLPYTINGTLTNSSDIPIVVTYTVTPKYNGCNDGPPQFITVTVEPTPRVTITTTTPVICDGSNVDVTINSPTVSNHTGES